jgi:S-adenosylmethionine synthetase
MEFLVTQNSRKFPAEGQFEIVERKGLGHPDTLADGIAESMSIDYSRYCLERYGAVLHHNLDKTAIIGGHFKSDFGQCERLAPVRVILNGRMSTAFGSEAIDIRTLQEESVRRYVSRILPDFDVQSDLRFEHFTSDYSKYNTWFRPRSLIDLPELNRKTASDTAVAVGYWPLTDTENLVLTLERYLNSSEIGPRYSFLGQDIKVMALRNQSEIKITMCVPFMSKVTRSSSYYFQQKERLSEELLRIANEQVSERYSIEISVNTSQTNPFGPKHHYLLGTGSCIECGEEGVVGRGNPPAGIISVQRIHTMEAPYGKNPVYHAGKVYAYLAMNLARVISITLECECEVYALTRHSDPLIPPKSLIIQTSQRLDRRQLEALADEHLVRADYLQAIVYQSALLPH